MDLLVAGKDRIAALRKEADEIQALVEAIQSGLDARQELIRRLTPPPLHAVVPAHSRLASKK